MLLHVSQDLAAEVKEVLKCSPQWKLQENTWATFERGEDIIVVEQYRTDGVLDMLAIFGPMDELEPGFEKNLKTNDLMFSWLWWWIEHETTPVLKRLLPEPTPRELVPCEPPF